MTPRPTSATTAAVLGVLYAHPHDDTPSAVAARAGLPVREVVDALQELRDQGLAAAHGGHWQLSAGGFIERRAAVLAA